MILECMLLNLLLYAVMMSYDRFWWNVKPKRKGEKEKERERSIIFCVLGHARGRILNCFSSACRTHLLRTEFQDLDAITDCPNFISHVLLSVLLRRTHTTNNSLRRARIFWLWKSWLKNLHNIVTRLYLFFFSAASTFKFKQSMNSSRFTKRTIENVTRSRWPLPLICSGHSQVESICFFFYLWFSPHAKIPCYGLLLCPFFVFQLSLTRLCEHLYISGFKYLITKRILRDSLKLKVLFVN